MVLLLALTKAGKTVLPLDEFGEVVVALLGELEADESRRRRREDKARALAAKSNERRDPLKGQPDSRANNKQKKAKERKPWSVEKGPCRHCGNGDASGTKQGHWHYDCPLLKSNGGTLEPEAAAPGGAAKMGKHASAAADDDADAPVD